MKSEPFIDNTSAWTRWYMANTGVGWVEATEECERQQRLANARRITYRIQNAAKEHKPTFCVWYPGEQAPSPELSLLIARTYRDLINRIDPRHKA